ncbi:MAG: pyridoxine 5'-phosphate synthase [Verrucomicrobiota bacterium]
MSTKSILLGVNIDHIATLRQARYVDAGRTAGQTVEPDPIMGALIAERAGADGITVHPREDARHVQREDVKRLREVIQTRLNMEMAATDDMLDFALEVRPDSICVVPENREEVTTEGGLDVTGNYERIGKIVTAADEAGIAVSLFIDPEPEQIEASAALKAGYVELHTGAYSNSYYASERAAEWDRLVDGANKACDSGLIVNAGHGINYVNIKEVRTLPHLNELNIGHSIMSRAIFSGLDEAVRELRALMRHG